MATDILELDDVQQWGRDSARASWSRDVIAVLLLLALCSFFFGRVLLNPDHLVNFNDTVKQFYVWRNFGETETHGESPLWLPYINSGEPFLANPQNAQFYPVDRLLLAILPTHLAIGYGYALHVFLAGVFMFLLGKHLFRDRFAAFVSAAVFMFSHYLMANIYAGHYTMTTTVAWLPLIFLLAKLAIDGGSLTFVLLASVPLGLQLLAGHPQITYLTIFLVGLYASFRFLTTIFEKRTLDFRAAKPFLTFTLLLVLGIGLSAVQLLPTYEFSRESARAGGLSYWFATIYSLPLPSITGILLPRLLGTPLDQSYIGSGPYHEFALYLGVMPLVLIPIYLRFRKTEAISLFFVGVALLSLLLALGNLTPLYRVFWRWFPGLDSFRVPARFLLLYTFCASVLSGYGLKRLTQRLTKVERQQLRSMTRALTLLLGIFALGLLVAFAFRETFLNKVTALFEQYYFSLAEPSRPYEYYASILRSAYYAALGDGLWLLLLLACSIFLLIWRLKQVKAAPLFVTVTAVIIVSNLWAYDYGFVQTEKLTTIYSESGFVSFLKENAGIERVYDKDGVLSHNFQIAYGLYTVGGYNTLRLANHWPVLSTLWQTPIEGSRGVLDILNARYVLTRSPIAVTWLSEVYHEEDVFVYENTRALPRAFVIPESEFTLYPTLESKAAQLNAGNQARPDSTRVVLYEPNEVLIDAELDQPGILVLSEIYYPGWKATVDQKRAELLEVYGLLRGVRLPSGQHMVDFTFDPESLRYGALLSIITLGVLVIGLTVSLRKPRLLSGWGAPEF